MLFLRRPRNYRSDGEERVRGPFVTNPPPLYQTGTSTLMIADARKLTGPTCYLIPILSGYHKEVFLSFHLAWLFVYTYNGCF